MDVSLLITASSVSASVISTSAAARIFTETATSCSSGRFTVRYRSFLIPTSSCSKLSPDHSPCRFWFENNARSCMFFNITSPVFSRVTVYTRSLPAFTVLSSVTTLTVKFGVFFLFSFSLSSSFDLPSDRLALS